MLLSNNNVLFIELPNGMRNVLNYMIPVVISDINSFLIGSPLIHPSHHPHVISNLAKIIVKLLSNI